MKLLITGGLGFIGINLVKSLLKRKKTKKIIIIDNMSKNSDDNLKSICEFTKSTSKYVPSKSRVHLVKVNISNPKIALQVTKDVDFVVHLAAESGVDLSIKNPMQAFDTNVVGAFNYLEASRINKVKGFIFASSGAVFGDVKPPIRENDKRDPISPYGSSKLSIETYCETYSNIFKLGTTILRFSNAYGPYSQHKNSVIHKFVRNILNNKSIRINGDGNHTRDFIYVDEEGRAIDEEGEYEVEGWKGQRAPFRRIRPAAPGPQDHHRQRDSGFPTRRRPSGRRCQDALCRHPATFVDPANTLSGTRA